MIEEGRTSNVALGAPRKRPAILRRHATMEGTPPMTLPVGEMAETESSEPSVRDGSCQSIVDDP